MPMQEAVKQVAVADRIVLTKVDLLVGREGEDQLFSIIGRLRKLAPGARLLTTHRNEATAARLFNTGLYDPKSKSANVRDWLNAEAYGKRREHRHHGMTTITATIIITISPAMTIISAPLPLPMTGRSVRRVLKCSSTWCAPSTARRCCA